MTAAGACHKALRSKEQSARNAQTELGSLLGQNTSFQHGGAAARQETGIRSIAPSQPSVIVIVLKKNA
jgi:hypothetical protein